MSLIVHTWIIRDKNETYPQTHICSVIRLVLYNCEKIKFLFAPGAEILDCPLLWTRGPIRDRLYLIKSGSNLVCSFAMIVILYCTQF